MIERVSRVHRALTIAVAGGDPAPQDALDTAEEVGRALAVAGVTVICGGRGGVMRAVCRGARSADGLTVGILPGEGDQGRAEANEYVQLAVATGIGSLRNGLVAKAGQALIAIDGGYGTLSEIGLALTSGIPVVGLGTWAVSGPGESNGGLVVATSPTDAVVKALKAIYAARQLAA